MEKLVKDVPMPDASATKVDRLKFLVDISRRSQAQFSTLIGIDPSAMSRLLSGKMPITDQFANRLVVNLGISKKWFTDGEGVPFPRTKEQEQVSRRGAAVYDIDATAGAVPISSMFASNRIIGYLNIPAINPECPVVRVSGDSMEPVVPNGSLISIREVRDPSIILWGNIYLVELEDYRMVKYVRRHPEDPSKVILHSSNPSYDDIDVPRNSVLRLFLVENVINCSTLV